MVRLSYFLLVFFLSFMSNAQDYTFRVLANRGENQVKKAGSKTLTELKTGTYLNENDEIITDTGSYVSLVHNSGKTIEIIGAGTKTVNELEKDLLIASADLSGELNKYYTRGIVLCGIIFLFGWFFILIKKQKYHQPEPY